MWLSRDANEYDISNQYTIIQNSNNLEPFLSYPEPTGGLLLYLGLIQRGSS